MSKLSDKVKQTILGKTSSIDYVGMEMALIRQGISPEAFTTLKTLLDTGVSWAELQSVVHAVRGVLDPAVPAPRSFGDESTAKVLRAVAKKPRLAFQLRDDLNRLVVSAWSWSASGENGKRSFHMGRHPAARIWKTKDPHNPWSWEVSAKNQNLFASGFDLRESRPPLSSKSSSKGEAMVVVDQHLQARGYIVPDPR